MNLFGEVDTKTGCMTACSTNGLRANAGAGGDRHRRAEGFDCGNLLQAFRDKPKQWDAWNIDEDFEKEHWDLDKADEVTLVESGPLRAILRVKNHFQNSTFVRDITVTAGSPRVDVNMDSGLA